jgi:hypothetical protein
MWRLGVRVRRVVIRLLTNLLTKPLHSYEQRVPNSLSSLKQGLRKGDVILIEGDQRVSQVIRYLTQSSWSHSCLYIGDDLNRHKPELAAQLADAHGDEAKHLVIEAVAGEGVICSPIAKYVPYNLRVCRPGLRREDLDRIVRELVSQLGVPYNVQQIFDLARYFFPVSLIPRRFRRALLHYGGDSTREVICSTMIARAFAHVGYPVLPRVTIDEVPTPDGWLGRLFRRNGNGIRAQYHEEDPALITPRDFDLSPYFEVVKFSPFGSGKFDYRRIEWASHQPTSPAPQPFVPETKTQAD